MPKIDKKPILCKLGVHRWFLDCAYFYSASRCGKCSQAKSKYEANRVEEERLFFEEAIAQHPKADFETICNMVAEEFGFSSTEDLEAWVDA